MLRYNDEDLIDLNKLLHQGISQSLVEMECDEEHEHDENENKSGDDSDDHVLQEATINEVTAWFAEYNATDLLPKFIEFRSCADIAEMDESFFDKIGIIKVPDIMTLRRMIREYKERHSTSQSISQSSPQTVP